MNDIRPTVKYRIPVPPFELLDSDKKYLVDMPARMVHILMSVQAGDSYANVAAAYNIPIGTVRSRVHRVKAYVLRKRAEKAPTT